MTKAIPEADRCPACRGRGWKFRRSRRAAVIGTLTRGSTTATRRSCLSCGGTGRVSQSSDKSVGDPGN